MIKSTLRDESALNLDFSANYSFRSQDLLTATFYAVNPQFRRIETTFISRKEPYKLRIPGLATTKKVERRFRCRVVNELGDVDVAVQFGLHHGVRTGELPE